MRRFTAAIVMMLVGFLPAFSPGSPELAADEKKPTAESYQLKPDEAPDISRLIFFDELRWIVGPFHVGFFQQWQVRKGEEIRVLTYQPLGDSKIRFIRWRIPKEGGGYNDFAHFVGEKEIYAAGGYWIKVDQQAATLSIRLEIKRDGQPTVVERTVDVPTWKLWRERGRR